MVGWVPVPKARPGSSSRLTASFSGASCQARHDPQALAETHRLEVVHPAAFPVLVLDHFGLVLGQICAGQQAQVGEHLLRVGIGLEQCQQVGVRPQRGGVEVWLEDRLIFGVHERDRDGADFKQGVFVGFGLFRADGQAYLQPGHGGHLW